MYSLPAACAALLTQLTQIDSVEAGCRSLTVPLDAAGDSLAGSALSRTGPSSGGSTVPARAGGALRRHSPLSDAISGGTGMSSSAG